ncbi:PAS domain S-box protein [uncultured Methanoregula sp.]|uniref:PAS domain S-box protein n=1 Tax=uncultured Methanoregula sp. TaxID=1005933 RepID=UPI002AAC073A|nr:PAS domain S-box protein [uncultured Methanoregula sp.]
MDFLYFDQVHKHPLIIPAIIGASGVVTLALNGYGLVLGITNVLPHLLYIPIILAAYYYPRRGLLFTGIISVIYLLEVTLTYPVLSDVWIASLSRIIVFIVIAGIISLLSGKMHHDTQMCHRLVSMVRSSNDAIIGKTLDGIITDWNDGAEQLYGYSAREVVGTSISILIPQHMKSEMPALLAKIRNNQPVERYETKRVTKDGKQIRISLSISPIKNAEGKVIGASSSAHDITAQKAMQEEILRAKNEWELTFNAVPDMIAIIDRNHRIVRINQPMAKRLNLTPDQVVGRACYQLVHKHNEPLGICPHSQLLSDGNPHSAEVHEDNLDGDFQVTVSPLHNPAGEVVGSVHILHDITESKKAQEVIADRERFLNHLLETISNPIFYKNKNGEFLGCNSSFEKYIGFKKDQIIGKTVYDIAPKELADIYSRKDNELYQFPGTQIYESQVRYADGSYHDVIFTKSTFNSREGRIEGIVGVILDITERKQGEVALQQANKKLNMLSSITRHDILNQLMGLKTFLELSREMVTNPDIRGYIEKEEQAAEAIGRQIEFTRYYQDIGVQTPRWHNLEKTVRDSLSQLDMTGIFLEISLPAIEVFADPLIEKVFYNLVENSIRHGGGVTCITLSGRERNGELIVSYRDNGVGIAPEDKPRLFQKGFGKNTGLGLFLSREILSITGLSIQESGTPGCGVWFEIVAPRGKYRILTLPSHEK